MNLQSLDFYTTRLLYLREFDVFKITIDLIGSHISYACVFLFVFVLLVFGNSVVVFLHLRTGQGPKECSGPQSSRATGLKVRTGGLQVNFSEL